MSFERVEVSEHDFDDATRSASRLDLVRENPTPVVGGLAVLVVAGLLFLASTGAFVLADPFGFGVRFGAVEPVPADDDGTLTAAEFHGRVAAEYGDTSMRWYGTRLELTYATDAEPGPPLAAEVVQIAEWYADYVGDGGDAAGLQLTADTADGRARVTIDSDDARAFAAGDISREEYQRRVLGSSG
jgi:hypothetical protein